MLFVSIEYLLECGFNAVSLCFNQQYLIIYILYIYILYCVVVPEDGTCANHVSSTTGLSVHIYQTLKICIFTCKNVLIMVKKLIINCANIYCSNMLYMSMLSCKIYIYFLIKCSQSELNKTELQ